MADPTNNPFGFDGLNDGGLDLADFAPKAKAVDRDKAAATRQVARDSGFTRRAPSPAPERPVVTPPATVSQPAPVAVATSKKRRVNITQLLGIQDRYPESERAQLNMLAPVPVVMRWRGLVKQAGDLPAWEILERAMDALEAQAKRGGKA